MIDHKDFMIGLQDLKDLRTKKAVQEQDVKDTNSEIGKLLFDLIEYMESTDQLAVKIDGLGMCSLTRTAKYSINDEQRAIFESWMNEHGEMEHVMAIHASKVHGYYKEKLENNEDLPPGIQTFIKTNITIRSA